MNNPLSIIISRLFAELDADVIDGHTTELFDINMTDAEITERGALDSLCNERKSKYDKDVPIGKQVF